MHRNELENVIFPGITLDGKDKFNYYDNYDFFFTQVNDQIMYGLLQDTPPERMVIINQS